MEDIEPSVWIEKHSDYLYNYAYLRIHNQEIVEDLVQDTLLAAIKGINNFERKSSVRTWLIAILKRKIIDYYRKVYHKKELPILDDQDFFYKDGVLEGNWKVNQAPKNSFYQNDKICNSKEFLSILEECLSELPPKMSAVFSMKEIDGYSTIEICEQLDITPSNLWVLMHRAKLQLRKSVEVRWLQS